MKRILIRIGCLIMAVVLYGCSSEKADNSVGNVEVITESGNVEEIEEPVSVYRYQQELNMLDDNYRTYYEVFLYSFYDSDGDGIGDINGLISKLDYINDGDSKTGTDLGFDGIWLMPIMKSTTYHKYDVVDYYEIDPQYGTMEDFKNLIAECDKRGIKVIVDLVLNHTSTKNNWFLSAVQSLPYDSCGKEICETEVLCREHNPYCNYYNFLEEKPNGGAYYSTGNGWFYEGVFWDQMPDLNLSDEGLRKELEAIMSFWLELGVGGFRLDAAKEFYSGNSEKNIEVLKWVTDYVKGISENYYLVAEVWDSFGIFSKYYASGIDSIFNFSFAQQDGKITKTLNFLDDSNSGSAFGDAMVLAQKTFLEYHNKAIDAPFFTNHDTARVAGYFSGNSLKIKMAAGMNLMMSGQVFIYYGEELGMSGSGIDENKRAPMYWSDEDMEGMTAGPPSMEHQEHYFASQEEQEQDESSIYNYYKRAIRLRNENPEIARGKISTVPDLKSGIQDKDICLIQKEYENSKIYMVYNISEVEKSIDLSLEEFGCEGIRGYLSATGDEVLLDGNTLKLPPYSIVVLK